MRSLSIVKQTDWKTILPLGGLFSVFTVFGRQLDQTGEVSFAQPFTWLWIVFFFLVFSVLLTLFWAILDGKLTIKNSAPQKAARKIGPFSKRLGFPLFLGLVLSYTITFLAVFPGFFTYDATIEYLYASKNSYFDQHPFLHTALLGNIALYSEQLFGTANVGIAVFLYAQMLLCVAVFLYSLYKLEKHGASAPFFWCSYVFYLLFPTIHMFVLCSTKDTLFSIAFLMLLWLLGDLILEPECCFTPPKLMLLALSLLSFLHLRNNAAYAWILFLPIFFLFLKKGKEKKGIIILLLFLTLFHFMANTVLTKQFVKYSVGFREMLSVPGQQLARVYAKRPDLYTDNEKKLLFTFYGEDDVNGYLPKLADPVKNGLHGSQLSAYTEEYFSLWAKIGLKAPDIYINATLANTYGFWYPLTVIDGYRGYEGMKGTILEDAETSYFGYLTEPPGERISLIPVLDRFYLYLSTRDLSKVIFPVSLLFSPGFWLWIFLTSLFYQIHRKRNEHLGPLLLVLLIWLTLQFGPIALVRYVLIFYFGVPYILWTFHNEGK